MHRLPFIGRHTLPFMEGAEERTRIFVAEEISDLADSERRFLEIVMRQLPAALVQKVSKTGAFVRDAALQGPDSCPTP